MRVIAETLFARLQVLQILWRWWGTLDQGGTRRGNVAVFIGLPAIVAAIVVGVGARADSLVGYLTGTTVIAGLLFGVVFQLSEWSRSSTSRLDAHRDGHHFIDDAELALARRRLALIRRVYNEVCWAFIVSIALLVVLAAQSTNSDGAGPVVTALASLLGAHLILLLVSAVTAAFTVTSADLDRQHS